jgi:hypothetical protein
MPVYGHQKPIQNSPWLPVDQCMGGCVHRAQRGWEGDRRGYNRTTEGETIKRVLGQEAVLCSQWRSGLSCDSFLLWLFFSREGPPPPSPPSITTILDRISSREQKEAKQTEKHKGCRSRLPTCHTPTVRPAQALGPKSKGWNGSTG